MQSIKQYTEVINGRIHINLPENFTEKRVELIILSIDEDNTDSSNFRQFFLEIPEMMDEEFEAIQEKRRHLNQWT